MMVTSDFEGFCLVICEAMCLGVPVISTRTAGPSEIIGNNEYGVLTGFEPTDMFAALKRWCEHPEERHAVARKALTHPNIYSVENTMNALYRLIDEPSE